MTGVKDVLLFSGGMDSLIAFLYLRKERGIDPLCVFAKMGHRYQYREAIAAVKLSEALATRLEFCDLFRFASIEKEDAEIPNRNAYLVLAASQYLDPKQEEGTIYLISQRGETILPDRSRKVFSIMADLSSELSGRNINVTSPFFDMTKQDMCEWYRDEVGDKNLLGLVVGCYDAHSQKSCGRCNCCFRSAVAKEHIGWFDVSEYDQDIRKWDGCEKYMAKMRGNVYEARREEQTLAVLRKWGYE